MDMHGHGHAWTWTCVDMDMDMHGHGRGHGHEHEHEVHVGVDVDMDVGEKVREDVGARHAEATPENQQGRRTLNLQPEIGVHPCIQTALTSEDGHTGNMM